MSITFEQNHGYPPNLQVIKLAENLHRTNSLLQNYHLPVAHILIGMSCGGRFLKPFLQIWCGNLENLHNFEVEDLIAYWIIVVKKKNWKADAKLFLKCSI